jgi:hypothetical protein
LCNAKTYNPATQQALKDFELREKYKAFALAQTADGWEFFGYAEGYRSPQKAQKAALEQCQKRVDKHETPGKCELIR